MSEPRNLSVFCVDDDPVQLHILCLALGLDRNILAKTASDARDALRALIMPDYKPDCILLDLVMPHVDGKLLFAEIRGLPHHATTPIIFMTARVGQSDEQSYRTIGAVGLIAKPYDPVGLAARVRALVDANVIAVDPTDGRPCGCPR